MSKTSRFTGKAGARFEDQGWRMRPIQNRGSGIENRLKINDWQVFLGWSLTTTLSRLRKHILWRYGLKSVTWSLGWIFQHYFSEICLIISLWNPLLGSFCVIKEDLCILCGGLFSLSTHALTCFVQFTVISFFFLRDFHEFKLRISFQK